MLHGFLDHPCSISNDHHVPWSSRKGYRKSNGILIPKLWVSGKKSCKRLQMRNLEQIQSGSSFFRSHLMKSPPKRRTKSVHFCHAILFRIVRIEWAVQHTTFFNFSLENTLQNWESNFAISVAPFLICTDTSVRANTQIAHPFPSEFAEAKVLLLTSKCKEATSENTRLKMTMKSTARISLSFWGSEKITCRLLAVELITLLWLAILRAHRFLCPLQQFNS